MSNGKELVAQLIKEGNDKGLSSEEIAQGLRAQPICGRTISPRDLVEVILPQQRQVPQCA